MTAKFLTKLRVERVWQTDNWVLVSDLGYSSDVLDRLILVPAGFVTDFASVPRLPLAFLLFGNLAQEAAAVHDFLYSTGLVSRELADEVFAEASEACGIAAWRRGPMWLGVRLFGGGRYVAATLPRPEQDTERDLERHTLLE